MGKNAHLEKIRPGVLSIIRVITVNINGLYISKGLKENNLNVLIKEKIHILRIWYKRYIFMYMYMYIHIHKDICIKKR